MKVYRKPLRKNVKILVVNSILKCHDGSQGTKTQQIGCHLSNFDGSTLTCRDHRVGIVPKKHATKTTPPNWSNKSTVFYCTVSCLNLLIQHDSRGSSQSLLAYLNGRTKSASWVECLEKHKLELCKQNKWALIPELPLTSTPAICHSSSSPRNVGQEGSFYVAWGFTELSCFGRDQPLPTRMDHECIMTSEKFKSRKGR